MFKLVVSGVVGVAAPAWIAPVSFEDRSSSAQPVPSAAQSMIEQIITLGRDEVDDARFRRRVQELVGVEIEPRDWEERIKGTFRNPWVLFGFAAQAVFMTRFVVQWIASERRKRSHVPVAFWWLSLAGGISLAAYALHRHDPVFLFGQTLGCAIYARNLILIRKRAWAKRELLEERANPRRAELQNIQT